MFEAIKRFFGIGLEKPRDCILRLLDDDYEWTGLELIDTSGGRLKNGTIYVHLAQLEDDGLIVSRQIASQFGRRAYKRQRPPGSPAAAQATAVKSS